jgi:1,4-alpha-glucan branching enzyme
VDFDWHGFEWIDCNDAENSTFSFIRRSKRPEDIIVVVLNATPEVRKGYRVGVPQPGFYKEVLNTDAGAYGGSNAGNMGGIHSEPVQHMGRQNSLPMTLPPLAAVFLKWVPW